MAKKPNNKSFHGIPTKYNGVQFRSRLEAKWAAFFDLLKWKWSYEPFDLPGWIPDFVIERNNRSFLVETKPTWTREEFIEHLKKIASASPKYDFIVCGPSLEIGRISSDYGFESCLSPGVYFALEEPSSPQTHRSSTASFAKCRACNRFVLSISSNVFDKGTCDFCGTTYGNRQITTNEQNHIADLFKQAGNAVQWKGPR